MLLERKLDKPSMRSPVENVRNWLKLVNLKMPLAITIVIFLLSIIVFKIIEKILSILD